MGMDQDAASNIGIDRRSLSAGLLEVMSGWSGEGPVLDQLTSIIPIAAMDWSPSDVKRRARRVLLGLVRPDVDLLPATAERWRTYMPRASDHTRASSASLSGRADWSRTVRLHGWPPRKYELRVRQLTDDGVALRTLAWLRKKLDEVVASTSGLAPVETRPLAEALEVISEALAAYHGLAPSRPDRSDLRALTGSGYPWSVVARVCDLLSRSERDPEFIAFELIAPEPEFLSRLFHLSVYGTAIRAMRAHRFVTVWRRPLAGPGRGAQVEAISPSGRHYDLWFEGGAARRHHGLRSAPYPEVVAPIPGAGGTIGVDVLLLQYPNRALMFECKCSENPGYVGRQGYHQAASYALEARSGLASDVWSFVVGPDELVVGNSASDSLRSSLGVVLGASSPSRLADVISAWLADDVATLQLG